jgi:uncharacterized membrane protein
MRRVIFPCLLAGALALGGCSTNYAGEGALAGGAAGALIGSGSGDTAEGAAIGAAAGAAGGSLIKKKNNDGCYKYDREGRRYWDSNC